MKKYTAIPCPQGRRTADDLSFELAELLELGILSPEDIQGMQKTA